MMHLILSLDGFDDLEPDTEMVREAVCFILFERYTAFLWEGTPYAPTVDEMLYRRPCEAVVMLALADQLKPIIEYALGPKWVKPYIHTPMVRVTRTRFDLHLEFS